MKCFHLFWAGGADNASGRSQIRSDAYFPNRKPILIRSLGFGNSREESHPKGSEKRMEGRRNQERKRKEGGKERGGEGKGEKEGRGGKGKE